MNSTNTLKVRDDHKPLEFAADGDSFKLNAGSDASWLGNAVTMDGDGRATHGWLERVQGRVLPVAPLSPNWIPACADMRGRVVTENGRFCTPPFELARRWMARWGNGAKDFSPLHVRDRRLPWMADVERPWMARACPEQAYRMRAFPNAGGR